LEAQRHQIYFTLYVSSFLLIFRFDAFALLKKDRKSGYQENVHVAVVSRPEVSPALFIDFGCSKSSGSAREFSFLPAGHAHAICLRKSTGI
jgi:hypothetical protein